MTSIGDGAFMGCESLESIEIPDSVTFIGGNAFTDCTILIQLSQRSGMTIEEFLRARYRNRYENVRQVLMAQRRAGNKKYTHPISKKPSEGLYGELAAREIPEDVWQYEIAKYLTK